MPAASTACETFTLGQCTFEVLYDGDRFLGLGTITIGEARVRSGRLPLRPYTEAFSGVVARELRFLGIEESAGELRVKLEMVFAPMMTKLLRDHSFDPIHELGDWDVERPAGSGRLDIVLREAGDAFNGVEFTGFSYHYEYQSEDTPLFFLLVMASWELDGDITGATVVSQSSCSDPVVTFAPETGWSTEGVIHFEEAGANPVMTHNLPRWASHQAFDFQYRDGKTLLGVFERVELIRSVVCRDAGKPELKHFDKHIFDESAHFSTAPKKILLNRGPRSEVGQRNLWTWTIQAVHDRARAEFGLREVEAIPHVGIAYWEGWNFDTWYRDLLPAAAAVGLEELWCENCKKSAYSEDAPLKGVWHWNKCAQHEFEVAESLGGEKKMKEFVERAIALGVRVVNWTNNDQAHSSPLNRAERFQEGSWFVMMEDTRQKYGGAYLGCMNALNFKVEAMRRHFVEAHITIKEQTGLDKYLFDSFYNLGFMPIDYSGSRPSTQWRELLQAFKELQDAGIEFRIESFGPFGQPQHGCPASYSLERAWACYKIYLGNNYTTVPGRPTFDDPRAGEAAGLFYAFGHMALPGIRLFEDGQRLDQRWGAAHRQAIKDYRDNRRFMHTRYLQEDGQSVLWHDAEGTKATLWNFTDREIALPGQVRDVTVGEDLPAAEQYALQANHVYAMTGVDLPREVGYSGS